MYFEPTKTVYEDIRKATVSSLFDEGFEVRITAVLGESAIAEWTPNKLCLGDPGNTVSLSVFDIPAWCIAVQYSDGRLLRFSGDGIGEGGKPDGVDDLLDRLFDLARQAGPMP
jgi:hypothetical protein